jgi:hypothetical protein
MATASSKAPSPAALLRELLPNSPLDEHLRILQVYVVVRLMANMPLAEYARMLGNHVSDYPTDLIRVADRLHIPLRLVTAGYDHECGLTQEDHLALYSKFVT